MHPSLHAQNFGELPFSLRPKRTAIAATKGNPCNSFAALESILRLAKQSPMGPQSHFMGLPACWLVLDPARIPSEPADLQDLLGGSPRGKTPLLAIKIIRRLKGIRPRALVDLWPRIWAWAKFFYPHMSRSDPGGPSELMIISDLFAFIERIPVEVVDTQPGVRIMLPKAWATFLGTGDPLTDFPSCAAFWTLDPPPSLRHIWLSMS
ncbi:hypothetical protein B0H16DRAFT_1473465 [Mycena metata]|uniref:Uncharacterized protein n=1 Tax=Mycena metata TaxID=1033252 RepID=A0AAD7MLH9_9AGAR|nr:hypothetical protein B0H16DRAFT_1473465 [Mycena metata]